ncbi:MAG: carbohydrate binding domain-containing protein [Phycisphaerales bacterium]|nr:MAG: carbohydrate binding domain-containing protein [Phycisphaerales bacterium]
MCRERVSILLSLLLCGSVGAGQFVPFVIPSQPNAHSLISAAAAEPITTDSERLVANGEQFRRGKERVRLWGVNLSFGANLPRREDAPHVAARLAAAGVNTVRCHHLDTSRWPRGLWNSRDGKTIEPEALERLDYFIDQLARHGICVNINLHVGRAHSEYLGLPKANRQYDKISNIFTPALVNAQKEFAGKLLTRVNPYRKVRYADDPAVAIVEITNENSFFMWDSENTLRTLPPYYADILRGKFNAWLQKRYGSDEKLRKPWSQGIKPLGPNLLKNSDFRLTDTGRNVPRQWRLEQHSGCKASASRQRYRSTDALRIEIATANDTEWHLQFNQGGFAVKEGQYYTVVFEAASDKPRSISCGVGQAHSPWANLGLSRRVELNDQWQQFQCGFVARAGDEDTRLSFSFGGSETPFYLANVELRPGGRTGLNEGESIRTGSVALFGNNESPERISDRMRFLAETEKAYFDDMRKFIIDELGCKALVTGTIVFGPLGLYAQSDMDFIDSHAYWQHPRFPGRPWDSGNWLIDQKPMTDYPQQATLFRLAAERLKGKPFTVSEYNHPAPLDSQAECVPMLASFAAAQDWDGLWLYTYSHSSDNWDREHMYSYFDIDTNPAKWGFMRAGTVIFRDGGIGHVRQFAHVGLAPPRQDTLASLAELHRKHDRNMAAIVADKAAIDWQDMLTTRVAVILSTRAGVGEVEQAQLPAKAAWSVAGDKGAYVASGARASVYVGHADRLQNASEGQIDVSSPEFVVVTVSALDNKPLRSSQKVLVTACGRCENTGMKFSADRRTVGRDWGGPPVQIEAVTGTVALPQGQWKCEALGPDGIPRFRVAMSKGVLKLSPEYETMWYLLTR